MIRDIAIWRVKERNERKFDLNIKFKRSVKIMINKEFVSYLRVFYTLGIQIIKRNWISFFCLEYFLRFLRVNDGKNSGLNCLRKI
jgi:hypothetical protein